jgi:Cys-rich protein (TIGR04453 family)
MAPHHSRIAMRVLLAFLLVAAACGSQSPTPDQAAPPSTTPAASQTPALPPADAAPPLDDCANACTEIAVCWEEENPGREYNQGGNCTSACESSTPEEKKSFFECVEKGRSECAKMVACG